MPRPPSGPKKRTGQRTNKREYLCLVNADLLDEGSVKASYGPVAKGQAARIGQDETALRETAQASRIAQDVTVLRQRAESHYTATFPYPAVVQSLGLDVFPVFLYEGRVSPSEVAAQDPWGYLVLAQVWIREALERVVRTQSFNQEGLDRLSDLMALRSQRLGAHNRLDWGDGEWPLTSGSIELRPVWRPPFSTPANLGMRVTQAVEELVEDLTANLDNGALKLRRCEFCEERLFLPYKAEQRTCSWCGPRASDARYVAADPERRREQWREYRDRKRRIEEARQKSGHAVALAAGKALRDSLLG